MKNIHILPTAEELLRNKYKLEGERGTLRIDQVSMFMIEFAKLHAEEALKEASEKAKQIEDPYAYTGNTGSEYPADYIIDKDSILNAYALENIK